MLQTETTALATGLRAQIVELDAELATVTAERSKFQHSTQDLDQQVSFYVAQLQSCQQSLADATAQHAMLQA